jgi:hypothetical protein
MYTPLSRFAPGKGPPVPIVQEARWAPESITGGTSCKFPKHNSGKVKIIDALSV